ncbi:MAG: hypothetical protein FJ100_05535 [Deltaproteobacteria bacterium]|nr:hypothetical protein [Deltaproteobacteria bacterium]
MAFVACGCMTKVADPVETRAEAAVADAQAEVDGASDGGDEAEIAAPATCGEGCPLWQVCLEGSCAPKPCTADAQCNADPLPPGADPHFCFKGQCQSYQCAKDADCPKGQQCNTLLYLCYDTPKGCAGSKDCDDGDKCTTDSCDLAGACQHKAIPLCCSNDFACDDGKGCTADACKNGQCTWTPLGKCCADSKDCADGNACTQDLCQGGVCKNPPGVGCCKSAAECDDLDPGSTDGCSNGTCTHVYAGLAATCSASAPCSQNACVKGTCTAGLCSYPKPAGPTCCTSDAQCGGDAKCQVPACKAATCTMQAVQGQGPHLRHRFDTAAINNWTVEKSSASVYFHFSTLTQVAGAGALRYGIPAKVSFEDSTANKGAATSPSIVLPASPALRFWTLLDVSPGTAIHQCGLDVHDAQTGAKLASVWSKNANLQSGTTAAKWVQQQVALPGNLAGKSIKLRAWFDQTKYDTSNKQKFGWLLDELEILGPCP